MKTLLVTGAAGFIGSHTAEALLERGDRVIALDNFNDYYDPARKRRNLEEVAAAAPDPSLLSVVEGDVRNRDLVRSLFAGETIDAVVNLAAMAGVRASIEKPLLYHEVNVTGTLHLLEAARDAGVKNFLLASTSSAYGATDTIPFVESDPCDRPLSPYAASKRSAELLCYTFHHLYGQNVTALRFFTVYGPRGRPDMMAYKLLDSIFQGIEIPLYNDGRMHRDWTYIDDIVGGVVAALDQPLGYEILNLGRGEPILLKDFVDTVQEVAGGRARLVTQPKMDADVLTTYADTSKTERLLGYKPHVSVREGIERFWAWYRRAVLDR